MSLKRLSKTVKYLQDIQGINIEKVGCYMQSGAEYDNETLDSEGNWKRDFSLVPVHNGLTTDKACPYLPILQDDKNISTNQAMVVETLFIQAYKESRNW